MLLIGVPEFFVHRHQAIQTTVDAETAKAQTVSSSVQLEGCRLAKGYTSKKIDHGPKTGLSVQKLRHHILVRSVSVPALQGSSGQTFRKRGK